MPSDLQSLTYFLFSMSVVKCMSWLSRSLGNKMYLQAAERRNIKSQGETTSKVWDEDISRPAVSMDPREECTFFFQGG